MSKAHKLKTTPALPTEVRTEAQPLPNQSNQPNRLPLPSWLPAAKTSLNRSLTEAKQANKETGKPAFSLNKEEINMADEAQSIAGSKQPKRKRPLQFNRQASLTTMVSE